MGNPKTVPIATSPEPSSDMIAYPTQRDIDADANQGSQVSPSTLGVTQMSSSTSPEAKITVVRPPLLHKFAMADPRALQMERLERLSKYRIHPAAIWVTNEPSRSGATAEVVQAKFQHAPNEIVAAKKLRFGDNTDKEKTSKASHLTAGFSNSRCGAKGIGL